MTSEAADASTPDGSTPDGGTPDGGEPAVGTGAGGSRFGNGSLSSAAGTGSLRERPTDAGDGVEEFEQYVVTDAGEHLPLSVNAEGAATVEPHAPRA